MVKIVLVLVTLIGPNGQEIQVNPAEVTSLRAPNEPGLAHFAPGTKCVLVMTDGKFIALSEACAAVSAKLEGSH